MKSFMRSAVGFLEAQGGIERDIFDHFFVRIKFQRAEAIGAGDSFGEPHQLLAKAQALKCRDEGNTVNQQVIRVFLEHQNAGGNAVLFQN